MSALLLVARLGLALVFTTAGSAKLLDRNATRTAVEGFGVPRQLSRTVGLALPAAELAVSAALLAPRVWLLAAEAALVLLLCFSAGITVFLIRGSELACHCFGRLSSGPAGWTTIARNAALGAVAAFVAVAGRSRPPSTAVTVVALAGLVGVGAGVVVLLASRHLRWLSLSRLEARTADRPRLLAAVRAAQRVATRVAPTGARPRGLPIGTRAPDFSTPGPSGSPATLVELLSHGLPVALIFTDEGCRPCRQLMPLVVEWQRDLRGRVLVAVVAAQEVAAAYDAVAFPGAVLVSRNGAIASRLAVGEARIRDLVEAAAGARLAVSQDPVVGSPEHR